MSIEVDNVQVRKMFAEGTQDRIRDGVVAAEGYRVLSLSEQLADCIFNHGKCAILRKFEIASIQNRH